MDISEELGGLYKDYYASGSNDKKRSLAAISTLQHIRAVQKDPLGRMVDVGAGDGSLLALLANTTMASELHGLEVSVSGINKIEQRSLPLLRTVKQFDGYTMPYADKEFDTALAIHVIEHVEHERLFIRELSRISNEIIVEVPLELTLRSERAVELGKPYGHINFYTRPTFLSLLESCGLEILSAQTTTSSLDYELHADPRLGRIKHTIRRLALKTFPRLAPKLMVYLFTVRARANN